MFLEILEVQEFSSYSLAGPFVLELIALRKNQVVLFQKRSADFHCHLVDFETSVQHRCANTMRTCGGPFQKRFHGFDPSTKVQEEKVHCGQIHDFGGHVRKASECRFLEFRQHAVRIEGHESRLGKTFFHRFRLERNASNSVVSRDEQHQAFNSFGVCLHKMPFAFHVERVELVGWVCRHTQHHHVMSSKNFVKIRCYLAAVTSENQKQVFPWISVGFSIYGR